MEISVDRMRDVAMEGVEATREHLTDLVERGADRTETSIDAGAGRAVSNIAEWADRSPRISFEVGAPRPRRWWLPVVAVVVVAVAVGAALRARRRRASPSSGDAGSGGELSVIRNEGGTWDVQRGDDAPLSTHPTQGEAIEHAGRWAREHGGGEVVVHGMDGAPRETKQFEGSSPG
jgi:hypothetical protein